MNETPPPGQRFAVSRLRLGSQISNRSPQTVDSPPQVVYLRCFHNSRLSGKKSKKTRGILMALAVDIVVFVAFIAAVVSVGILMSRQEKDSESYFLAGRGLSWWLIGFSLIAANISTEQFVGMSGQAADYLGLAIASYEWMAAITLVIVAFFFLPKFLSSGIYTIPEFLEYRYNHLARTMMSILMMLTYVCVTIAAVIYSGAKTADVMFGDTVVLGLSLNITSASWIIGILAAVYVAAGGLKACAWADLLQGSALIIGGAIVVVLAMSALGAADPESIGLAADQVNLGAVERFQELNGGKLHMVLPMNDMFVPWTALVIGLWIPNFYYWGLNQYIIQRTLGSKSLSEGQKGTVFAAALKLIIPFIVVFPGIIAFNLYSQEMKEDASTKTNQETLDIYETAKTDPVGSKVAFKFNGDFEKLYPELTRQLVAFNAAAAGVSAPEAETLVDANKKLLKQIAESNATASAAEQIEVQKQMIGYQFDSAFGLLIKKLIPPGLRGFMLAAILGAVMSSLASMLNAASTIFTMDIYAQYVNRNASQESLVRVGRICVAVFVAIGCFIAPWLGHPRFGGIFTYIQEFQGFISPGILGVFIFGLFIHRAPKACGVVGLTLSPILYGILKLAVPNLAFLDRMAVTFFCVLAVMGIMTLVRPLSQPIKLPTQNKIKLESSPGAKIVGTLVVVATLVLYAIFW